MAATSKEDARKLIEFLLEPTQQEVFAQNNHEFPVVAGARPSKEIAQFGHFKRDPIDVDGAGAHLDGGAQAHGRGGVGLSAPGGVPIASPSARSSAQCSWQGR